MEKTLAVRIKDQLGWQIVQRYPLIAGLVLMFAITWTIELGYAGWLPIRIPFPVYLFLGWGFVFSAVIITGMVSGKAAVKKLLRRFLHWRVGWQWYLAALLFIPAASILAVYLHAWRTGLAVDYSQVFAVRIFGPSANLLLLALPYFLFEVIANGEEIGWRGFVLPRLQARYSALAAALIVGGIWSIWHLPKFISDWDWLQFAWFSLRWLSRSILLTWLYNNSAGSLLLVTLFHASDNTAGMLLPVTVELGAPGPEVLITTVLFEVILAASVVRLAGPERLSQRLPKIVEGG